jgi:pSer/pThr/pTyr-binding forkhead associated (FHA) protein
MITLVLHRQNERFERTLDDGVYRIGRETPADLVIADPTISAMHAELMVQGEACTIRDLGSTNGTWLNGAVVRSASPVTPADQLFFGSVAASIARPARPALPVRDRAALPLETTMPVTRARAPLSWTARSWIAAAEALLCCCVVIAVVILIDSASASSTRRTNRFREFAAQYVHILSNATAHLPPPSPDASFSPPIRIFKADGQLVYPEAAGPAAKALMINPSTKEIYEGTSHDLFPLPMPSGAEGPQIYSYPVRNGGDLLGFVTAAYSEDKDSNLGFALLSLLIAASLSAIMLYLTMRPVHQLVASELGRVRERISAVANGVIEELPRSTIVPEINPLNAAIEDSLRQRLNRPSDAAGGRLTGRDFSTELAGLVGRAAIAYCFVDADYNLLHVSAELHTYREFAGAGPGRTLFAPTLSAVQAKNLVQLINAEAPLRSTELELTRGHKRCQVAVYVRRFQQGGKVIHGVLFCPPRE